MKTRARVVQQIIKLWNFVPLGKRVLVASLIPVISGSCCEEYYNLNIIIIIIIIFHFLEVEHGWNVRIIRYDVKYFIFI